MTAITYPNVWGETRDQAHERRQRTKRICALLRSDLYEPAADPDPDNGMTWRSPLGWTVRLEPPGPKLTITDPRGELYATIENADVWNVDEVLP